MSEPDSATAPDEQTPSPLPPHINAKVHAKVMARLAEMTDEEFLALLVRAGICTPDGELTEHYKDGPEEDAAEAAAE